jgi:hypothetical protein
MNAPNIGSARDTFSALKPSSLPQIKGPCGRQIQPSEALFTQRANHHRKRQYIRGAPSLQPPGIKRGATVPRTRAA